MSRRYKFTDIASRFTFGKHKGESLCAVLADDPSYIYWCINNIPGPDFTLSKRVITQICEFFPKFIISKTFQNHIY